MDNWKEYGLGDVYSFSSGLSKSRDQFGFGFPFLSFKEVFHNYFIPDDLPLLANTSKKERSKCSIKRGDVFLTRTSEKQNELGMSSVALKDYPEATFNGFTKRLRPLGNIEVVPEYAGYYFRSRKFRAMVSSMSSMTTRASLNNDMLKHLKIRLPKINTQNAIAEVLISLDDKIDLLHRQNKTLEAMAETLFRQWFVEEADESWEEGVISDIANHSKISVKPQSNENLLYNHYSIPSYDDNKKPVKEYGIEIKSNKYQVINNSVLFSKLNPHKDKRLWLIQDEPVNEAHICSTEFQVVEPYEKENLYFIYGWLFLNDNYREIASGVGGTSGSHQRISPDIIFGFPCPLVPSSYVKEYNLKAEPIFQKQRRNHKQIQTLTNLRDTLLPKLMSGEVRVNSKQFVKV